MEKLFNDDQEIALLLEELIEIIESDDFDNINIIVICLLAFKR